MISLTNVHKTYVTKKRSVTALKAVSLEIPDGVAYGVLGLNGSGKTTLISAITGLLKPTEGEVIINGYTVHDGVDYRKQFSTVYQQNGAEYYLNVADNLKIHGMLHGYRKKHLIDKVEGVMSLFALDDYAGFRTNELSGGYARRLQCAKALMVDSNIYIFDEATTGMDVVIKNTLFSEIDSLRRLGKTIIFTTQQLDEVERVCSHLLILREGEIIANGSLMEVRGRLSNMNTLYIKAEPLTKGQELAIHTLINEKLVDKEFTSKVDVEQGLVDVTMRGSIASLQGLLQEMLDACQVIEYGVRKATLEEIMLGLSKEEVK